MTSPTNGMPLMTIDSAWRQWRRAATDLEAMKGRELTDPFAAARDTRRAEEQEQQARATWFQTQLGWFEQRRADAIELGHDVTSTPALRGLGVPCIDCKRYAPEAPGTHRIKKNDQALYPVHATCGGEAVNPVSEDMPVWPPSS